MVGIVALGVLLICGLFALWRGLVEGLMRRDTAN